MRLLLALLLALAPAAPLRAQLPGPKDYDWGQHRRDVVSASYRQTAALLETWQGAWMRADTDATLALYSPAAHLVLPSGVIVRGDTELRAGLLDLFPAAPVELSLFVTDFTALSELAYAAGSFTYRYRDLAGVERERNGAHLTVFSRERGRWRIRSQAFILPPPTPG